MEIPNPALMAAYGTGRFFLSNLEKQAALPTPAAVGAPLASLALWQADQEHVERQLVEAALLSQLFREEEAERQADVIAGMKGRKSLSPSGQAAQQLNQMRAYQAMLSLMNKQGSADWAERLGGTLAHRAVSADGLDKEGALPLVAGLVRGAGSLLRGGGATARLTRAAVQGGVASAPQVARAVTPASARAFQAVGRGMQAAPQVVGRGLQGAARGVSGGVQAVGQRVQGAVGRVRGPRAAAPAAPAVPKVAPATPAPVSAPAAVSTPGGQARPSMLGKAWQSVRPGWKTKALAGGAVLGTGYMGVKGLQAARDYMMHPTYASQAWGGYGMSPAPGLNQYGYAPHVG